MIASLTPPNINNKSSKCMHFELFFNLFLDFLTFADSFYYLYLVVLNSQSYRLVLALDYYFVYRNIFVLIFFIHRLIKYQFIAMLIIFYILNYELFLLM